VPDGELMNPIASKTYQILKFVLDYSMFSQRMICRKTNISLGQINKVFQWLEDNNFIEKVRKIILTNVPKNLGVVRYRLTNPTGLVRATSFFRKMKNNKILELNLDLKKEDVIKYLTSKKVIFCLETALEKYDSYFRGDTVCCYIEPTSKINNIKKDLSTIKFGLTKVQFYSWDFQDYDINDPTNSQNYYTTELQTIIDLFCDNKAHYTKELLKRKWGIVL